MQQVAQQPRSQVPWERGWLRTQQLSLIVVCRSNMKDASRRRTGDQEKRVEKQRHYTFDMSSKLSLRLLWF